MCISSWLILGMYEDLYRSLRSAARTVLDAKEAQSRRHAYVGTQVSKAERLCLCLCSGQ
jgi:hypothetical protein